MYIVFVANSGPCASQPCPNGAACSAQGSGYTCGCVDLPPYNISSNERGEIINWITSFDTIFCTLTNKPGKFGVCEWSVRLQYKSYFGRSEKIFTLKNWWL